jgi:hypothetical protein
MRGVDRGGKTVQSSERLAERNPEADSRHALLADPSRPAANNGFSRHFVEQTTGTIHLN